MGSNRNPSIDGPRIPSPEVYRSNSPSTSISPSTSPSRHSRNFSKSFDPLLRDLSPTSTLRAFTTSSDATNGKSGDQLFRSIASASVSERAFGARIAQTCRDIRAWCDELQRWEWPDSFAAPPEAEKTGTHVEYWGSLPRDLVVAHEKRIDEIRDALEELDVEHLKSYVLSAHTQPKSPQPGYDSAARTDYMAANPQHLDDFTALITATILQALPHLSRLNSLLNTWSVRVSVLRKLPGYLRELQQVKLEIDASWSAISQDISAGQTEPGLLRTNFETIHGRLGKRISRLGGRLDSVLDDLEGREETLPDHYIDDFETLETAYGDWVMQTEREVMNQDLNSDFAQGNPENPFKSTAPTPVGTTSSAVESIGKEAARPVGLNVVIDGHDLVNNSASSVYGGETLDHGERSGSPPLQAESPVLGNSIMSFGGANGDGELNSDSDSLPPSGHSNTKELAELSTSQLPDVNLSRNSSTTYDQQPSPLPALSPVRSRHVPIVVGYDEKEAISTTSTTEATSASSFRASPALSEEPPRKPSTNNVRNRAAFLNGGIEQTQTLQKSPSPVRPFEHASQAFTKLFQRANAAQYQNQHTRSASGTSASSRGSGTGSLRRAFPPGNKKDAGGALQRSNTSMSSLQSINDTSAFELETPVSDAELSSKGSRSDHSTRTAAPPTESSFATPETQFGFEPSTRESKSTIESAWNSPALSDFPENWPLPVHMDDEEITSPKESIDANSFEKMFVDSLPASPNGPHQLHAHEDNPMEVSNMKNDSRPHSRDRVLSKKAPISDHRMPSPMQSLASSKLRNTPSLTRQDLSRDNMLLSEASTPGSFQSNLSTPEVQSALAAGYFRPKEVETSPVSRISSASTAKHIRGKDSSSSQSGVQRESELEVQPRAKRASAASIESFSRSELKTVDISETSRSASFSSSSPISPTRSAASPELPRSPPRNVQTPVVSPSPKGRGGRGEKLDMSSSPPLNLAMPKRRLLVAEEPVLQTSTKHNQAISGAEQLDRQVSRVLSSLPSRIRFTPASFDLSTTPEPTKGNRRPSTALSSRTGLTLTPAQPDEKSRRSKPTDPEVKVYHLSKEGREQPIKLHVRLVGEGERVMVRVGGGWADLGDYLRQYAEHHGRRTISDGRFEVAGVNTSGGAKGSSKVRTSLSRPGSVLDRPTSRLSQRRRSSLSFMVPFNSRSDSPTQEENEEGTMTPTPPGTADASQGTPTSISTKSGSRPSTADAAYSSSPGSSWNGAGLAGPANKKHGKDLDQHKAQWVESMIERATKASVEKKKTDEKTWGDIGKVGGTRRVIFKQPQKDGQANQ